MGGDKDLLVQDGLLEQEMYEQVFRLRKQITAIKKILEPSNEKGFNNDSTIDVDRMQ